MEVCDLDGGMSPGWRSGSGKVVWVQEVGLGPRVEVWAPVWWSEPQIEDWVRGWKSGSWHGGLGPGMKG